MKKFSVQFAVYAPSDEGVPFREWAYVICENKDAVAKALRVLLIAKGFLQIGEYVSIYKVIEED